MLNDPYQVKENVKRWIRDYFEKNGKGCFAVIGISGGKDSSVAAALCAEALGKERVVGVLMPNGIQSDIEDAKRLVDFLGIPYLAVNIGTAVAALCQELEKDSAFQNIVGSPELSKDSKLNLPARIRMATLYAVSQSINGRVANTCNLSEDYVGYATRYGDGAGDFSPLCNLTVTEVKEIGRVLGLPEILITKTPIDGLSGKSDKENLGFTYDVLDRYILNGEISDLDIKEKIDRLHMLNRFKIETIPGFRKD